VQNLVHGEPESIDQIFSEGGILFQTTEKQLINPRPDISLQVSLHLGWRFPFVIFACVLCFV
jgi:hypothetical protein